MLLGGEKVALRVGHRLYDKWALGSYHVCMAAALLRGGENNILPKHVLIRKPGYLPLRQINEPHGENPNMGRSLVSGCAAPSMIQPRGVRREGSNAHVL
jgi:hypothetical protein